MPKDDISPRCNAITSGAAMLIRMDAASPTSKGYIEILFRTLSHQRVETRGRGVLSNTLSRGSRGILLKFIAGQ